jgi:hypothetical protein
MLPVEFRHDGEQDREATELGNQTRIDQAIAERYHSAARPEKKKVLDEFIQVTGYHRKHAIRALRKTSEISAAPAPRSRIYDEAVQHALTILWETADRICGKRLKEAIPTQVDAMEWYGHLQLDPEIRRLLLTMSAATMDRVLKPIQGSAHDHDPAVTHCFNVFARDVIGQGNARIARVGAGLSTNLQLAVQHDPLGGQFKIFFICEAQFAVDP